MIPTGHWLNYLIGGLLTLALFGGWFYLMKRKRKL
jgi:LPXTG-motif cell wall-anchored protein